MSIPIFSVLTAKHPRLYFNLPSKTSAQGAIKELSFTQDEKLPAYISVFPDRAGQDEHYQLEIIWEDSKGPRPALVMPIHVVDQHRDSATMLPLHVDFAQDKTGFFQDDEKRAVIVQAARDWAYYLEDMNPYLCPRGKNRR